MRFLKILSILIVSTICSSLYAQNTECEERLRKHVAFFTNDSLLGRKAGSPGEMAAAGYLYDRLIDAGVEMITPRSGQDFMIAQEVADTIFSRNIVGIVEGYDKVYKNEYILIGAHIDHLGTNILTVNGQKVFQIYPGADDNASGLACMIEVAERIASSALSFRRSVIFAGFGAQNLGMAGAWYFANRAFNEVDSISLMINLNMVGRLGLSNDFTYYTCVPNSEIAYTIGQLPKKVSVMTPVNGGGTAIPSDYLAFYDKNIPVALFTTGTHRDYHSVRDTPELLDYEAMSRICEFVYMFTREVANKDRMISRFVISGPESESGDRVYSPYEVDKPPQFFHGDEKVFLERWVYDYLKYPDIPLSMGISGQVYVEFIIEKDGSMSNVKVIKSVDQDLDAEAVRVIAASPKWKPGTLGGQKVRVKFASPVEFKLKKR